MKKALFIAAIVTSSVILFFLLGMLTGDLFYGWISQVAISGLYVSGLPLGVLDIILGIGLIAAGSISIKANRAPVSGPLAGVVSMGIGLLGAFFGLAWRAYT